MELQCECGKFRAQLKAFPKNSPGRLKCYCDDCQTYMHSLKRADLLDENGGTEIIPAYPADIQILTGLEQLKCMRLSDKGMFRYSTLCCNTPIGNTRPNLPWVGLHRRAYTVKDPHGLDRAYAKIRSRIMGRYAKGTPPAGTPPKFNFWAFASVMPFILKGRLLKKFKPSPFFQEDGITAVVTPHLLSAEERKAARSLAGF